MEKIKLSGQAREGLGKKYAKSVRNEGNIPCVLYSSSENIHFSVKPLEVRDLIFTPAFRTAEVELNGNTHPCIVKDVQWHPVTDEIVHIDFLELEANRPVKVDLPVAFHGVSPGVKGGGKLQKNLQKVKVKTTPENMVDILNLDISTLELGQAVRVRDIAPIDGVEIITAGATPVATVEIPRALRSASSAEEKEAAAAGAAPAEGGEAGGEEGEGSGEE
jgi:large subunit ribosomal protein L25